MPEMLPAGLNVEEVGAWLEGRAAWLDSPHGEELVWRCLAVAGVGD